MKKWVLLVATIVSFTTHAENISTVSFHLGDNGFESGVFSIVKDGVVYGSVNVHAGFDGFITLDPYAMPHEGNHAFSFCFSGSTPKRTTPSSAWLSVEEPCACQTTKTYQLSNNQSVMLDRTNVDGDWRGFGCTYQM